MAASRFSLRKCFFLLVLCALGLQLMQPALAQERWPTKPVKLVVPFPASGTADGVARILAQKLSVAWGQQVVIENRSGAGGNLGTEAVAKSAPDGYSLVMVSGSIPTINPYIYKRLPFDVKRDLTPITNVATGPMLVLVPDSSPAKNIKELIAQGKAKPGSLNLGSAGVGSQVHMAGENFAYAAGIEITHVPYRGETVAFVDLIAGQLQLMVGNLGVASTQLGPGRLRALAVTSKTRSTLLPNVPTVAESGLPGFESTGWFGLMAPASTPKDILAKIQRDTARALGDTDVKARLYVMGMAPVGNSTVDFAKAIDTESKRWAEVIKSRNITAN